MNQRTNIRTSVRRRSRQLGVAGVVLALLLCGRANFVKAQVLEQVPDNALVVLKIKNLDEVSRKAAKMAKDLGLDQFDPQFADPLGALEESAHISKGVNKAGDLAIAYIDPDAVGGDKEKSALALVPVSDFKAFLGNFKDAAAEGGVTKAKTADGDDVYIAEWGKYAAVSPSKDVVAKKPHGGVKLQGLAAKESASKDALVYANMTALRAKALPALKKGRGELLEQFEKGINDSPGGEMLKPYAPILRALVNTYLNGAEEFLTDARAATLGLNLGDEGISATVMADFEPGSYIGKFVSSNKNTDASLLTGLPDRKYFMVGGSTGDPKASSQLIHDILDPIKAEMAKVENTRKFVPALEAMEKAAGVTTGMSMGYVAPAGALGAESVIQEVAVIRGDDVKVIQNSQRQTLQAMSDLVTSLPQQKEMKVNFNLQKDAKTVEGVKFDSFETKFDISDDNPQGPQIKQMMALIYGPTGQTGLLGQVNDKSLLLVQGAPDQLIADAVASAKKDDDAVSKQPGIKAIASQLPKSRSAVFYLDLDNILVTAIRDAKGLGVPVPAKLPANLPPIGMTAGSEESAFRVDAFIPKTLVQGLVSAGVQMQQQQKGPGGGL